MSSGVGSARSISSLVLCVSLGAALYAIGCLSSSDTPATLPPRDAGSLDASIPPFDSGTSITPPGNDASSPSDDAGDAGSPEDAAPPPDAGPPNGSQVGLVGGGSVSTSAHYTLVGSAGPTLAPVLESASYQLTGGLSASSR